MSASLSRLQSFYSDLSPPLLLHAVIKREFRGTIAVLTSFGPQAGPLLALVAAVDPATPVLFFSAKATADASQHYAQTLTTQLGLANVQIFSSGPEELLEAIEDKGLLALITDRRQKGLPKIELGGNGVFHINPLAQWGEEEQNEAMVKHAIPSHPSAPCDAENAIACAQLLGVPADAPDVPPADWSL